MHMQVTRKNGNGPVQKLVLEAATEQGQAALEDILASLQAVKPDHAKVKEVLKAQSPEITDAKAVAPRETLTVAPAKEATTAKEKTANVQGPK